MVIYHEILLELYHSTCNKYIIGWDRAVQFTLYQKIILHTDKLLNTDINTQQIINTIHPA